MLDYGMCESSVSTVDVAGMISVARSAGVTGQLNNFIPALARVPRDKFGFVVNDGSRELVCFGDVTDRFSIQSISKLFALIALLKNSTGEVWKRVGSTGSATERFDSMAMLEFKRGIPTHPFLNSGALVMTDMLLDITDDPVGLVLGLISELGAKTGIEVNEEVAASEIETADRNRALTYYLRSFGNVGNKVDKVVEAYCRMCAIELSCCQLASVATSFFANANGRADRLELLHEDYKMLISVMRECGLYEESGEIGVALDMPAKSGSGGGILAVIGNRYAVSIWAPPLGPRGNSAAGISLLKQLGRALQVGAMGK